MHPLEVYKKGALFCKNNRLLMVILMDAVCKWASNDAPIRRPAASNTTLSTLDRCSCPHPTGTTRSPQSPTKQSPERKRKIWQGEELRKQSATSGARPAVWLVPPATAGARSPHSTQLLQDRKII